MVSSKSSVLRKFLLFCYSFSMVIGKGLDWSCITFLIIGLFLDSVFVVVLGNIQLICALIVIVGPTSFMERLKNRQNYKACLSFGSVGFVFILLGWPKIGLLLGQCGVAVLFSELWPPFVRDLMGQQPHEPSLVGRQKGKRRFKNRVKAVQRLEVQ